MSFLLAVYRINIYGPVIVSTTITVCSAVTNLCLAPRFICLPC